MTSKKSEQGSDSIEEMLKICKEILDEIEEGPDDGDSME